MTDQVLVEEIAQSLKRIADALEKIEANMPYPYAQPIAVGPAIGGMPVAPQPTMWVAYNPGTTIGSSCTCQPGGNGGTSAMCPIHGGNGERV